MLEGLMQHDHPLTMGHVLERMRGMNGDGEVVTLTEDAVRRARYAEVAERVDRLCAGLRELGVEVGDRVVGKFDKKVLRRRLEDGELEVAGDEVAGP